MHNIEDLYKLHSEQLRKTILRYTKNEDDADDVLQETFTRAYNNLDTFRDDSNVVTWLTRIAVNTAINFLDKQAREKTTPFLTDEEGEVLYPSSHQSLDSPESMLSQSEMIDAIWEAVETMPDIFAECVVLKDIHQLTEKEIAEKLDLQQNTVKTRIHRGREYIKSNIQPFLAP